IHRVRNEFDKLRGAGAEEWIREAKRICALTADGDEPPICLHGPDRGTVSSTVLGIACDAGHSRYWHAPGPPDEMSYEDHSSLFREMLVRGTGRATPDIELPEDSPARRAVRESVTWRVKVRDDRAAADTSPSPLEGAPGAAP